MVNREIRLLLFKKLNISQQAISKRAKTIKEIYGPMSTDEAVYIIAHQNKIDLSKYLSLKEIDRIRSLVPKEIGISNEIGFKDKIKNKNKKRKEKDINYPLVNQNIIDKSIKYGHETFPLIFILETSIRNLIINILSKKYGNDWWLKSNIKNIRDNVDKIIKKEEKFPYREKRSKDPINYTNFDDLKRIILNEQSAFKDVIIDFQWFEGKMNEIYMARNALAHSNLINKYDHIRIDLFFRDWSKVLESAGLK